VTVLLEVALLLSLSRQGAPPAPTPAQIEQEVFENVQKQPLGDGTVEDLALPSEFVRRVADRIVRASYEERYRIVVRDEASPAAPASRKPWLLISTTALVAACAAWIVIARRREAAAR
jgi:hypothetical protein